MALMHVVARLSRTRLYKKSTIVCIDHVSDYDSSTGRAVSRAQSRSMEGVALASGVCGDQYASAAADIDDRYAESRPFRVDVRPQFRKQIRTRV